MSQIWTNNAATTLASAVTTNSQTSLTLASGKGALFPSTAYPDYFMLTLDDGTNIEIVQCTARTADTLTVVRAQEGTTAQTSFAIGTKAELRVTAGSLSALVNRSPSVSYPASPTSFTPTPNYDVFQLANLGATITVNNPTGTWGVYQKLTLSFIDTGTARSITWGNYYIGMGLTLPTTTVAGKYLLVSIIAFNNRFYVVSVAQE